MGVATFISHFVGKKSKIRLFHRLRWHGARASGIKEQLEVLE